MAYLISVTENYRVNSDAEVTQIIESAKKSSDYELSKYNYSIKEVKQKGEVVDSWYKLSLTKIFQSEKEPFRVVDISYGIDELEIDTYDDSDDE